MKKTLLLLSASMLMACTGNKTNESAPAEEETAVVETEEVAIDYDYELTPVDEYDLEEFYAAQEFVSQFITEPEVISEDWIMSHCSPAVIQRLRDDNPYEGDGLAVWELLGDVFESENINAEAEVVAFGYGMLRGKPVYTVEEMYDKEDDTAFATLYFGLERQGEDFRITFFDFRVN